MSQKKPRERKLVEGFAWAGIMIDFDNLSAHCDFLDRGLTGERERFEAYVRERTVGLDQDERDYFFEMHSDDHWRISDVFPALQAASAFLLTYALFEKSLNDICRYANCHEDLGLSFKDFRGQGIERAKLYLSKVCGLASVFNGKEWQEAVKISNLRNAVSHASGELDLNNDQHKKAFDYAKSRRDINVVRHVPDAGAADIALTLEFVKHAVDSLRSFLGKVCSQRVSES